MPKDDSGRLLDMLAAVEKAISFSSGMARSSLDENEMLALALVRLLEIIGEAARFVPDPIKWSYPEVPWQEIAGTRNRLIHGYFAVDLDIVWAIIQNDLPTLAVQLRKILKQEE